MSRGFVAALVGVAVTLLAWVGPWAWPAWPAFTVLRLTFGNAFARFPFAVRAATVVALIAINVAFWGAAFAVLTRAATAAVGAVRPRRG